MYSNEDPRKPGYNHNLPDAVRHVRLYDSDLAFRVVDDIGMHPSSEPILAELQRQWNG